MQLRPAVGIEQASRQAESHKRAHKTVARTSTQDSHTQPIDMDQVKEWARKERRTRAARRLLLRTATGAQLRGRPGPAAALGIPKSIQTQVLMGRPRAPQVPAAPGSSPPRPLAKVMHSGVGCRRRFQRRPSTEGA
jgi:hypothetical protein